MLTPDCVLEIIHSFLLLRQKEFFCVTREEDFALCRPGDLCGPELLRQLCEDLQTFFMLDGLRMAGGEILADMALRIQEDWRKNSGRIAFRTSGSTGKAKICVHDAADLAEECAFLQSMLACRQKFLACVPTHHCYGFMFGLLLPQALGRPRQRMAPMPGAFFANLTEGCAGIGFPEIYETDIAHPCPRDVELVCASGPVAAASMERLAREGFGILEIFGSSETGVLGCRRNPREPFRLAPHFEKAGLAAVRRGSRVIALADRLEWLGRDLFLPRGRLDQMVQIGGMNVSPMQVARKIREIEGVLDCAVRVQQNESGKRLKTFVVPEAGQDAAQLRRRIRRETAAWPAEERPAQISCGSSLPRNEMGKLCDWC